MPYSERFRAAKIVATLLFFIYPAFILIPAYVLLNPSSKNFSSNSKDGVALLEYLLTGQMVWVIYAAVVGTGALMAFICGPKLIDKMLEKIPM